MAELGRVLRRERARCLWLQQRVADACGISRQQLSRYETGTAEPSWEVFRRILAAYGKQPRIELEPLDADIVNAVERQRRRPRSEWLLDVRYAAKSLHRLLAGLEWQATGAFALRLLGAPVPVTVLDVEVAVDDAGWQRLFESTCRSPAALVDPESRDAASVFDVDDLRRICTAGDGSLRYHTTEGWLALHVVEELGGTAVQVDVGEWRWPVTSVDRLRLDDPWMARMLDHLRRDQKTG